jgi:epoxyqueuosine reductase
MGKHTNIITRTHGSFFFIAELIIDHAIEPDGPIPDYCGTCTACIDECPTDAIVQPYVVDGSKCISYLTIELKEAIIDPVFKGQMDNWAFGCDICQDVCPWNRFSKAHKEPRFAPKAALGNLSQKDWHEMTDEVFNELFKRSPIKRTMLEGMQRNVRFLKKG